MNRTERRKALKAKLNEEYARDLESIRKRKELALQSVNTMLKVISGIEMLGFTEEQAYWAPIPDGVVGKYRAHTAYNGWHVSIEMKVNGFTAMASPQLAKLLERLEGMGYELSSDDRPSSNTRTYHAHPDGLPSIHVEARLKGEDTDMCKRVAIGSRIEVVTDYKFVCLGEGDAQIPVS